MKYLYILLTLILFVSEVKSAEFFTVTGLTKQFYQPPKISDDLNLNYLINHDEIFMFHRGWDWSYGLHLFCPPNPGDNIKNNELIKYWVIGYIKGIENGGNSDMPSRYLVYLKLK